MAKSKKNIDEITLILIVAIAALLISFFSRTSQPAVQEVSRITDMVLSSKSSLEGNPVIDEKKLMEIKNMDYASLKGFLNIKRDFCIYIEDEQGNIILAKGSPSLNKDGICVA